MRASGFEVLGQNSSVTFRKWCHGSFTPLVGRVIDRGWPGPMLSVLLEEAPGAAPERPGVGVKLWAGVERSECGAQPLSLPMAGNLQPPAPERTGPKPVFVEWGGRDCCLVRARSYSSAMLCQGDLAVWGLQGR